MFVSPTIHSANLWRTISSIASCFFFPFWLELMLEIKNQGKNRSQNIWRYSLYIPAVIFSIRSYFLDPYAILSKVNGIWLDKYAQTFTKTMFDLYPVVYILIGLFFLFRWGKSSRLKREKKQAKAILITTIVSLVLGELTDTLLPSFVIGMPPLAASFAIIGIIGIGYSITRYKFLSINPEYASAYLFEYIFKAVNKPMLIVGDDDLIIYKANDIALEVLGHDIILKKFDSLVQNGESLFSMLVQNESLNNTEIRVFRGGTYFEFDLSGKIIRDEFMDSLGTVIILNDVSERKKIEKFLRQNNAELQDKVQEESSNRMSAENMIQYLAYHDELTGLPNRRYFNEFLTNLIETQKENDRFCILFLDLDNFKLINDTYGHPQGDALLKHYANHLKYCVRENDVVARIGGDEFLIAIPNLVENTIEVLTKRIQSVFREPFLIENRENYISTSIGIACYPNDGKDYKTLVMNADMAMYEAKNAGNNQVRTCTNEIKQSIASKLTLINSLNKALENEELMVYYQPQINAQTNKIVGFEALLRWYLNKERFITPTEFIPLAEETGLIIPIGYWVIETACKNLKEWQTKGDEYLRMAINLSSIQLNNSNFVENVKNIISKTKIDPRTLEFEITEKVIIKGDIIVLKTLENLKTLGVNISVDDFGIEYSSLMNLKKLPIDKIKIAMDFVKGLNKNTEDDVIIDSIISMSKNLGLEIIAEGVETKEQLDFLISKKCDLIQGYYYYKPIPDTEITQVLGKKKMRI